MERHKCPKNLGVLAMGSECCGGCEAVMKVADRSRHEGYSRETLEQIVKEVSKSACHGAKMVLPRGSQRMI